MDWKDITYRQLLDIRDAANIEDENDKTIAVMQAVFGDNIIELPISEFNKKCKELEFLQKDIPNDLHVNNIKVNDREYYFDGMLGNISTAQYIDFQRYIQNNDDIKAYSVFFIPKGHKYNDGYDMLQVFEDIQNIPAPTLLSASFFFKKQLELFIKIFQHYSMKHLKKLMVPKEMKMRLTTLVENLSNLESSLMSSSFVK